MNVEQLITRYVYTNGEIALQGIGLIKLTETLPDAEYLQKHKDLPVTGIEFTYQPSVTTTPAFTKFYGEQRGKIHSLAESDIQAFLQMAVQLLNIGNPFELKGVGVLSKQNDGRLVLTPGYFTLVKEGEEAPNRFKERQPIEDTRTGTGRQPDESRSSNRRPLRLFGGIAAALAVAFAGWWIYSNFIGVSANNDNAIADTAVAADTIQVFDTSMAINPALTDSGMLPMAQVDSLTVVNWKAIFRYETGKDKAIAVLSNYQKSRTKVEMETSDSVNFSYYVIVPAPARDTLRVTDSLRRFFARPVTLQRLQ